MRVRTGHPHLAAAACTAYGLMIWLYPTAFRRAFGRELVVTFRSRVEDVLDGGGVRDWLAFAAHVAWDTIRTSGTLVAAREASESGSLLGLSEGDAAHGCIDHATVDVELMFAAAGLVLAVIGWYAYFAILPFYVL
jgi:hypothetical protein